VTVSPTAATNALTGYGVSFSTSITGGLSGAAGSQVDVTFPSGFGLSGTFGGYSTLADLTTGETVGYATTISGQTLAFAISSGQVVGASDELLAWAKGVTNQASPSTTATVLVSTTSDPTPVASGTFSVTAAVSVSGVTVSVTGPTSAAGSLTDYTASFSTSTTGGMSYTAGSTITVTFPAGFSANELSCSSTADCNNLITDTTSGDVVGYLSGSANVVTGHISCCQQSSVNGGDTLRLVMDGITNSTTASTTDTLTVRTTSDNASAVASNTFSVGAHHAAGAPTLKSTTTLAAGGTTSYTVRFTTSSTGGLSGDDGSSVTVNLPASAVFQFRGDASSIFDVTTGQPLTSSTALFSPAGSAVTGYLGPGAVVNPGDALLVTLNGVANPTSAGPYSVTVSTSSDSVSAASNTVTVTAAAAVSGVTAAVTGPTAAAGGLTGYTVRFTTSASGGLSGSSGSQVTVSLPAGFSSQLASQSALIDTTTGTTIGSVYGSGTTVTGSLQSGAIANPGDTLSADLLGVVNSTTTSNTDTMSVVTTSDTLSAASGPFSVTASSPVTSVSTALSGPTEAAGGLTGYRVTFTTSSSGALSPTVGSALTIGLPSGFSLDTSGAHWSILDTTTDTVVGSCGAAAFCSYSGGTLPVSASVAAHGTLQVTIDGVVNGAASTTAKITVATTSDPTVITASNAVPVVGAHPVTSATVTTTGPTNAAGGLTGYTITFKTSTTGGLSPVVGSYLTLGLPSTFGLSPFNPYWNFSVVDTTTGATVGSCAQANYCVEFSLSQPILLSRAVKAGDTLAVTISGIVNGPASTTDKVTVSTSSDPAAVSSTAFTVGASHPTSSALISVSPSKAVGAITGWTATFTTSSTGALSGAVGSYVELYLPTVTGTSALCSYSGVYPDPSTVVDLTTNTQVANQTLCSSGNEFVFYVLAHAVVHAGDKLVATMNGLTNPAKPGTYKLQLRTSSDPAQVTSSSVTLAAPNNITVPVLTRSSSVHGALSTYTVTFATSTTGGLAGRVGSAAILVFPEGTNLNALTGVTMTDNTSHEVVAQTWVVRSSTELSITLENTNREETDAVVSAKDSLTVVVQGIGNPAVGSYALQASTTSDWYPEPTATYAIS